MMLLTSFCTYDLLHYLSVLNSYFIENVFSSFLKAASNLDIWGKGKLLKISYIFSLRNFTLNFQAYNDLPDSWPKQVLVIVRKNG